MTFKIKIKIILITLLAGLVLGGFFYLVNKKDEIIVYNEDEVVKAKESVEEIKDIPQDVMESSDVELTENNESANDLQKKEEVIVENNKKKPEVFKEVKNNGSDFGIKDNLVTWGFTASTDRNIDTIILHSSYNALGGDKYDLDKLILEYKEYGVAPHYVIDRSGNILRLVKDRNVAYHAGESNVPDGRKNVNNFSVGIELMNTKDDKYTAEQYDAVNNLIKFLKNEYEIKYILGHNQIAPERKTDPWNIDWDKINK